LALSSGSSRGNGTRALPPNMLLQPPVTRLQAGARRRAGSRQRLNSGVRRTLGRKAARMIPFTTAITMASGVLMASIAVAQDAAPAKWRWLEQCSTPYRTHFTVRLDGEPLLDTDLPVCHLVDAARPVGLKAKLIRFHFKTDLKIFGDEYAELGVQDVEGNVWEAGGDPTDIVFGLSFTASQRILLNTLHVAYANKTAAFDQAMGLQSVSTGFTKADTAAASRRRRTRG
jgi:hypothetical protein